MNKIAYWNKEPERGDIVVFTTSGIEDPHIRKDTFFIKRIVGLPGETISIDPPSVHANGEKLTEPEIIAKISKKANGYDGYFLAHAGTQDAVLTTEQSSLVLGEDEYLVLGDNSRYSLDSRYFGPITRASIVGKAFYVHAPVERKKRIK